MKSRPGERSRGSGSVSVSGSGGPQPPVAAVAAEREPSLHPNPEWWRSVTDLMTCGRFYSPVAWISNGK
ncbi:Protein of unknown function [Gryllus bimaculatus]|nr:Protein of unknown function [Gryllus bimaculatus]